MTDVNNILQQALDAESRRYLASPVWDCCGKPVCACGKAKNPPLVRAMIRAAIDEDAGEPSERGQPDMTHKARAQQLWRSLDENERTGVRFGLFPHLKLQAVEREGFHLRAMVLALMQVAAENGGMQV